MATKTRSHETTDLFVISWFRGDSTRLNLSRFLLEIDAEPDPDDARRQNLRGSQIGPADSGVQVHDRSGIADVEEVDLRGDPSAAKTEGARDPKIEFLHAREPFVAAVAQRDGLSRARQRDA